MIVPEIFEKKLRIECHMGYFLIFLLLAMILWHRTYLSKFYSNSRGFDTWEDDYEYSKY